MSSESTGDRPGGAASRFTLPGRFHAVVFDLDGVLVDTEPGWRRAETELLRRRGDAYTEADAAASLGAPVDVVVGRYATRLGLVETEVSRLREELMELARAEYGAVTLLPGALELVGALHGLIPMGVASNTPRELVLFALTATALEGSFDAVVTAEDAERPKPAPDIYLSACQRLDVAPADAVALEDSSPGIQAAHHAGLTVIAVPQAVGVDTAGADYVAKRLTDLLGS